MPLLSMCFMMGPINKIYKASPCLSSDDVRLNVVPGLLMHVVESGINIGDLGMWQSWGGGFGYSLTTAEVTAI